MTIPVPARKQRLKLQLSLRALRPLSLGIWVYDPRYARTAYFRRRVVFQAPGSREISIPLPLTPRYLELEIFNKQTGTDAGFKLEDVSSQAMPAASLWASPEHHRFMEFAMGFARKAGYARPGFYPSTDDAFLIQYLPVISDELGHELITPARIHRSMPRVQLSQKMFRQFSIPVRIAILSHEGCHFFQNTRSEAQADRCGLKYYLDYGFPKIEAVYAATQVFNLHPESVGEVHLQRTRELMDFIDTYPVQS